MKLLQVLTMTTLFFSTTAFGSEIPFPQQKILDNKIITSENQVISIDDLDPRPGFAGYYLAGRHAQVEQDWKAANYYFDIVSRKDPINYDLKRRTMVIAMGAGDLKTAAEYAGELLAQSPGDPLAILFMSTNALKDKDYKSSLEYLAKMEKGGMTSFASPILKGWIKAMMGQFDIADLKEQPLDAYHAALIGRLLDKKEDSLKFLNKTLAATKDSPSLKLADAFLILGEDETAKNLYQSLIKENYGINITNRISYIDKKNLTEKPDFLGQINAQEGLGLAYIDMAKILYAQESADSARIFVYLGLEVAPQLEDGHILLAKIYSETGRFEEAISHYQKIPQTSRYYREIQLKIAEIQESLGQSDKAISELNTLNEKQPHGDLLTQIGDIERRNENYKLAVKYYDQAIAFFGETLPNEYWFLYYVRGMSYERLGKWERAEADFKKALEFQPNDPFVLNYLAYGWAERGVNLNKSLEYLERAVSRKPTDGHIRDSLGWVYYKLGQYENAIDPLEKAITFLPYDPIVNEHLGDAYWQVGRQREALFQWKRALNYLEDSEDTVKVDDNLQNPEAVRLQQKLLEGLPVEQNVRAAENKILK